MRDWCETLARELGVGRTLVMVTVVEVLGSAPCAPGAKLLVADDKLWGTVGGGNLEFTAIGQARKLAVSSRSSLLQSLPLGPILSQCCGGRVTLLFERFGPKHAPIFAEALSQGGLFRTCIDPDRYERCHLAASTATSTTYGLVDGHWIEPAMHACRQVVIFGGGHVGKALARILGAVPCDLLVVDPRSQVAQKFDPLVRVVATQSSEGMDHWWRPGSVAVILTHSHELDYLWVRTLLLRGDAAWCGVIGSKTKRARFVKRLRADGVAQERIARLVCPIGLSGLNSKHPGAVAISTAAGLLPLLADLSPARAGQSCECALPGNHIILESMQ